MVEGALAMETTELPDREFGTPVAHKACKDGRRATVLMVKDDKYVVTVGTPKSAFPDYPNEVEWETAAQVCSRESAMTALDLIAA